MSRRTVASLLSMALVVVLGLAMAFVSVPYVTWSPGPTVDVLGKSDGKPIVEVEGHRTYPTKGSLDLVTVLVTNPSARMNLYAALKGWLEPTTAVLPRDVVYPPGTTAEDEEAQDSAQMVNSQDTAVAAALTQARLRARAAAKLGPRSGELLLTADGLEQATRPRLAALHARRFVDAGVREVWDLGCGLGLDAAAFADAGLRVLAVDADEATAALAAENLRGRPLSSHLSRPETLEAFLDHVDATYGGVEPMLQRIGWTDEDTARLRAKLRDTAEQN